MVTWPLNESLVGNEGSAVFTTHHNDIADWVNAAHELWLDPLHSDYGATGDGSADDWAALDACFQAARQTNAGPGRVLLPGGHSFAVSKTLVVPNSVWVSGFGQGKADGTAGMPSIRAHASFKGDAGASLVEWGGSASQVTVTVTATDNAVNWTGHGLSANQKLKFTNTGTGGAPELSTGTYYWVKTVTDVNRFTLAATNGGAEITITEDSTGTWELILWGGNGFTTNLTGLNLGHPEYTFTVTDTANDYLNRVGHGRSVGDGITITDAGTGGAGLTNGTQYWVSSVPDADNFTVSATKGGATVNITSVTAGTWRYAATLGTLVNANIDIDDRSTAHQLFMQNRSGDGLTLNSATNGWLGDMRSDHTEGWMVTINSPGSDSYVFGNLEYDNMSANSPAGIIRVVDTSANTSQSPACITIKSLLAEVHTATTGSGLIEFTLSSASGNGQLYIFFTAMGHIMVGPNAGNTPIFWAENDAAAAVPDRIQIVTKKISNAQSTGGIIGNVGSYSAPPTGMKELPSFVWAPREYNGSYQYGIPWNEASVHVRNLNVGGPAVPDDATSGQQVIRMAVADSNPSADPTEGIILYVDTADGKLKFRGVGIAGTFDYT